MNYPYNKVNFSKLLIAFSIFLMAFQDCHSSNPDTALTTFSVGIRSDFGFIIPHSNKIEELSHTNPWGIELDLNWHLTKYNIWQYCFCYPRTGFSIFYTNYSNPDVIGSSIAFYPYIEPFTNAEKKISPFVRFGMGPAYMTKIYDPDDNPKNLFNASHLSFIVVLKSGINYRVNKNLSIRLAGSYNHISNGGIKQPNLGINFPTVNAGIDWSLTSVKFPGYEKRTNVLPNPERFRFDIYLFGTGKIDHKNSETHLINGLGVNFSERVSRINAITCGVEYINDGEIKYLAVNNNITGKKGEIIDHHRAAVLFGHELLLGRFIFSQQLGFYLYSPFEPIDAVYQRYGLLFNVSDKLFTGINIKAHRHIADFLDLRLGMSF